MTILVIQNARQQLARSFYRDIYNVNDYFYLFASRAEPWADDTSPEVPRDSQFYVQQYKHDMLFVKRIQPADAVLLAPRYDWASGTIYDQYDDEYADNHPAYSGVTNLADAKFFVMTDEFNVYKCLNNNENSQSTIKPTSTGTDIFELDDGYVWKFMFQVGSADRTKFLSTSFIPVRKISGSGAPAFDVNGEIDSITVTAGGSGYTSAPTVVINGDGTGATATASLSGDAVDSISIDTAGYGYSFATVTLSGGGGTGATATAELGSTETPSLQQSVESTAINGTIDRIIVNEGGIDYVIGDATVVITGDGTGATASATINEAGTITGITLTDTGENYTFADITILQSVGSGTGATFRAIISPYGGHGSNAPKELFAKNVGVTLSFVSDDNDIVIGNDFRQVGIIKNITTYTESGVSSTLFTEATGTPCHVIEVPDHTEYNLDDIIENEDSSGKFRVIQKLDTDDDGTIESIYLQEIIPGIEVSSTLENTTTGSTGLTINSVTDPEFTNHSGDVLYIDNIRPITRDEDQVETIKVIFKF